MKFTTVTIKEIQADKTHRLDAGYWIKKKSLKQQAPSATKKTQLRRITKIESNKLWKKKNTLKKKY